MIAYANYGGDSGVYGYELGDDRIWVRFNDGSTYLYTYSSAGSSTIEQMKRLAVSGQGLNEYINRFVKKGYESKF